MNYYIFFTVLVLFFNIALFPTISFGEWCDESNQTEPPIFENFDYATDVFIAWENSKCDDISLGRSIGALISSFRFFIHKDDLRGYSTGTLERLLQVTEILKKEERIFSHEPFIKRREAFLQVESEIVKIMECRKSERRKKIQHIFK